MKPSVHDPFDPPRLGDLAIGARAVIDHVGCDRAVARRLMEMGLVPGTTVEIVRVAPLGDPIQLRVRHYALTIRRADAAHIEVQEVPA